MTGQLLKHAFAARSQQASLHLGRQHRRARAATDRAFLP
jgi:hypothetical protein